MLLADLDQVFLSTLIIHLLLVVFLVSFLDIAVSISITLGYDLAEQTLRDSEHIEIVEHPHGSVLET
jgi:hypothetical protein